MNSLHPSAAAKQLADCLPSSTTSVQAVVAVPICNEEDRIAACLAPLLIQAREAQDAAGTIGLVLVFNNCADRSLEIARSLCGATVPVAILQTTLSGDHANAGWARGLALELAALWLERHGQPDGVLLTTDADSRAPLDWIARNLNAINKGCDGVAGQVILDPLEEASLPQVLLRRGERENAYEQALLALSARLDPLDHDPWPNHWTTSGASLAVTLRAYRAIGSLPPIGCGEDRMLALALERRDLRIRHDPSITVVTSARLHGRAKGGVADTMRMRCAAPDMPGDDCLEAFPQAMRRYIWRGWLRRSYLSGKLWRGALWQKALKLTSGFQWKDYKHFGALWNDIEEASPPLAKKALRPSQMSSHTLAANAALCVLGAPAREKSNNQADRPPFAPAQSFEPATPKP